MTYVQGSHYFKLHLMNEKNSVSSFLLEVKVYSTCNKGLFVSRFISFVCSGGIYPNDLKTLVCVLESII